MGLGIVEPYSESGNPPGTATLLDDEGTVERVSKSAIILVPQPSSSPRDPLVGAASQTLPLIYTYTSIRIGHYGRKTLPCWQCAFLSQSEESRIPYSRP